MRAPRAAPGPGAHRREPTQKHHITIDPDGTRRKGLALPGGSAVSALGPWPTRTSRRRPRKRPGQPQPARSAVCFCVAAELVAVRRRGEGEDDWGATLWRPATHVRGVLSSGHNLPPAH